MAAAQWKPSRVGLAVTSKPRSGFIMRLMDCLANTREPFHVVRNGRVFEIAGAAAYSEDLKACPLRYALDDSVAEVCLRLLDTDRGMLDPANSLLRLPAENFWVEWREERPVGASSLSTKPRHVGILVNAALDGRSGTVHSFWKSDEGGVDAGQIYIEFDLDSPLCRIEPGNRRAVHVELPEFQPLLDCMTFSVEPAWKAYFAELSPTLLMQTFERCSAGIWLDLAFAFAFATLLNSRGHIESRSSDLARLNSARAKRGKTELLDHIETRLCIDERSATRMGEGRTREAPRLHQVRGHLVRRADATFWRTTHLRGDAGTILLPRNVRVIQRHGIYAER
jgi:hypothetical protein